MGRRKKKNGHFMGFWLDAANVARSPVEETSSQGSLRISEQNMSSENSGMELNVPRQHDHSSSQNMRAVASGYQSEKHDHKAQSHDVFDQKTADRYHNTRKPTKNEYDDISKDVTQSQRSDHRNCNERKYYDINHSQDSYSWKDDHKRERSVYHKQNSYHYENPSQEPNPKGKTVLRTMSCAVCLFEYNAKDRKPKNLKCGHSLCLLCVQKLIQNSSVQCPECRSKTHQVHSPDDLSVNYSLLQLLEVLSQKSPHTSKCIEVDAPIESHCATCEEWVCGDCGRIDHNSATCRLVPYKKALSQIEQAKISMAENAQQNLKKSVSEAKNYSDILTTCTGIMETTFDCIKKEHKRLRKVPEDSEQVKADLQSSIGAMSKAKDLKEKLSAFKKVDESVIYTKEWASSDSSSHRSSRVKKLSKELLCTMVEIHSASIGNGSSSRILAMHTVNNTKMFSKLMCEGGRIHIFSLTQTAPPSGSHALPLDSIKSCMDSASALTFLDLSWGRSHGRVYIRLTGDSIRGRQFLILCTGEEGPSFCNTPFHRVWWKGLPGEHVWGGDYDQNDGSGGTKVQNVNENGMPPEEGRKLPITAGLVAGRYEKTNISSLFRIFTKDAKDVEEEAAFGQVEYGLQFVDHAINSNNIQDVIISDCGIVIEL